METKLSIVNHLLATVGERRVTTLETGHPSVIQAMQALEGYDLDFQLEGHWFNTNYNQQLAPDNRGEIVLPKECLQFAVNREELSNMTLNGKEKYVRRNGKVYNCKTNTYDIGMTLIADIVVRIEIEDMPPVAQRYLKHFAAIQYYIDDDGDVQKAQLLQERIQYAKAALMAEKLKIQAVNSLQSPAAQEMLYRINGMRGGYSGNPLIPGGGT